MTITLERATENDAGTYLDLEISVSGLKTYSTILDKDEALKEIKKTQIYFIKKSDQVVGHVAYERKDGGHVYISSLVVIPGFQGQGIAREAMNLVLEGIKDVKRIDLVTHPDNKAAINLYESLGFKIESREENYFGDGEPRIVMAKQ